MNNILTINDFTGDVQLSVSDFILQEFNKFIEAEQPKFLRKILGVTMYNELAAATLTETKWSNLLNGADFTYSDVLVHFNGVKNCFKYYVYALWVRNHAAMHSGGSFVMVKNENATDIVPLAQYVYAQNECLETWIEVDAFCYTESSTYTTYAGNAPFENTANLFGF